MSGEWRPGDEALGKGTANESVNVLVVASECDLYGHDYQVLTMVQSRDPEKIVCGRCGMSWKAERGG